MSDGLLKLKWNGHLSSFLQVLQNLRSKSRYTDVTLACEGKLFTVHRLVLASCSNFFDHIFEQTPSENTVIVLNESRVHDVEALLDYMYCGQVDVQQSDLPSFLKTAECLQIKGLAVPDLSESISTGVPTDVADNDICQSPPSKKRKPFHLFQPRVNSNERIRAPAVSNVRVPAPIDTPLPVSSPPTLSSNSHSNRWIFHRSDLPNTTWSSSQLGRELPDDEEINDRRNFDAKRLHSSSEHEAIDPASFNSHPLNQKGNLSLYSREHSPHHMINDLSQNNCEKAQNRRDKSINEISGDSGIDDRPKVKVEVKQEVFPTDYANNEVEDDSEFQVDGLRNIRNSAMTSGGFVIHDNRDPSIPVPLVKGFLSHNPTGSIWDSINSVGITDPCYIPSSVAANHSTVSSKLMPFAKCSNCGTNNTKLWRRSIRGEIVCNACGLYYKLHGVNRPSHLFRNAPMTRRRNPRKKKLESDESGEGMDHTMQSDDLNDSLYTESGCDSDTQEGLAVLNAALTLNSLFAKAKAQEAANLAKEKDSSNHLPRSAASDGSDSRPPPALLKLSNISSEELPSMEKYGIDQPNSSEEFDKSTKNYELNVESKSKSSKLFFEETLPPMQQENYHQSDLSNVERFQRDQT